MSAMTAPRVLTKAEEAQVTRDLADNDLNKDDIPHILHSLRRARAALGRAQWAPCSESSPNDGLACPVCKNWQEQGHDADCPIPAALGEQR